MPQTTPPPYVGITGISRADMKDNAQETLANYNGNARPGELVVNLDVDPPTVWVGNNLGLLTAVGSGGGSATWATLGDKNNASGPTEIALGQDSGTGQGTMAVAIGALAGNTAQGIGAVAMGAYAGSTNQGQGALALGGGAGVTNQGANAVAVGQSAGITNQGADALALGAQAGTTDQATNSIVINATGAPLENTVANTLVVAPMREGGTGGSLPAGFFQMAYNPTTGEIIYWS